MNHSPADIIARMLYTSSGALFSLPAAGESDVWPIYTTSMPDGDGVPDDCACVFDTAGEKKGRLLDGRSMYSYGFQVLIRSSMHRDGWKKAVDLEALFEETHNEEVVFDESGDEAGTYLIDVITQTSPILCLGNEQPQGRRQLFSINCLVMMKQTS